MCGRSGGLEDRKGGPGHRRQGRGGGHQPDADPWHRIVHRGQDPRRVEISRIFSKASFASLSGTAPLLASSGQTHRPRLNRRGNRQLNWALHYIALVQARTTEEAKAYLARQREAQVTQGGHALPQTTLVQRRLPAPRHRRKGGSSRPLDNIEGQVRRRVWRRPGQPVRSRPAFVLSRAASSSRTGLLARHHQQVL